jgi:hypothetical protein
MSRWSGRTRDRGHPGKLAASVVSESGQSALGQAPATAHSPEDLKNFTHFANRDYYIKFVATGPMVCAMIYVKDVSTWSGQVDAYLDDQSQILLEENRKPLYKQAGSAEKYENGKLAATDKPGGTPEYYADLIAQIPNHGKTVQDNSIDFCRRFAKKYNYKFLSWPKLGDCTIL